MRVVFAALRLHRDSVDLFVLLSGKRALIPTSCFPPHTDQLRTHTHTRGARAHVVGGGSRHTHTQTRSRRREEATHTHTHIGGNPISCRKQHSLNLLFLFF